MKPILEVQELTTSFSKDTRRLKAVDDVSFAVYPGRTLCIVGESGCGKSVTSLSIMRLIPYPAGSIESGKILFGGRNLLELDSEEMRQVRGKSISMIFQEPMTSLNPVFTVGSQLIEAIQVHEPISKKDAHLRAVELLKSVGIAAPEERMSAYPHQLSGGMRQRVMIAMALSCTPELLIADEPTTALDVTIQAQILELLKKLQKEKNLSLVFITHDLGVVAEIADDVAVMYAGQIVEQGTVRDIFKNPRHPYTIGLLNCIPKPNQKSRLQAIGGIVPDLLALPPGCRFQDRCPNVQLACQTSAPSLQNTVSIEGKPHWVRCIQAERVT